VKLAGFDLHRYELPLSEPLALKGIVLRHRKGLLSELIGEKGAVGWDEASPLPGFGRENRDEAARQLRDLASSMVGREITADWIDPDGNFGREPDAMDLAPSVRFGFELALWDLYAAARKKALAELVASRPRATVPVNALIAASPTKPSIELVQALNEELGDAVSLRLDANRAWSLEEAERFARGTVALRFEYVEEPLADTAWLPSFARACGVPVALDESLAGIVPEALEAHGCARAVVLKPTLLGGISRTLRFAARASRLGVESVISPTYETGVGTAALVALAAGVGNEEVPGGSRHVPPAGGDVLRPRLDLSAPRVDVRAMEGTRREIDRRLLRPVG
jgi:o-succinylbenzoate synthase